jgi:hypothetical protein
MGVDTKEYQQAASRADRGGGDDDDDEPWLNDSLIILSTPALALRRKRPSVFM